MKLVFILLFYQLETINILLAFSFVVTHVIFAVDMLDLINFENIQLFCDLLIIRNLIFAYLIFIFHLFVFEVRSYIDFIISSYSFLIRIRSVLFFIAFRYYLCEFAIIPFSVQLEFYYSFIQKHYEIHNQPFSIFLLYCDKISAYPFII